MASSGSTELRPRPPHPSRPPWCLPNRAALAVRHPGNPWTGGWEGSRLALRCNPQRREVARVRQGRRRDRFKDLGRKLSNPQRDEGGEPARCQNLLGCHQKPIGKLAHRRLDRWLPRRSALALPGTIRRSHHTPSTALIRETLRMGIYGALNVRNALPTHPSRTAVLQHGALILQVQRWDHWNWQRVFLSIPPTWTGLRASHCY